MLKILYCNWCLTSRSGTEVVTLETVRALQASGNQVAVLVWHAGKSANELRQAGILVFTSLDELPWTPDVIHSNHLPQTLQCTLKFPITPQVFFCHDSCAAHSSPPSLPNIRRYGAVDEVCAERVRTVSVGQVTILHNAVDLVRFQQRERLPDRPTRAVMLGKKIAGIAAVHDACKQLDISLDALGTSVEQEVTDLAARLQAYDLVFAVARNAIESMATGCAVVVVDDRGLAGLVRSENVDEWRRHNFGKRILTREPTFQALVKEILAIDPDDANAVCNRIRDVAALDDYLPELLRLYESVVLQSCESPLDARGVLDAFPSAFCTAIPQLLQLMSLQEIRQFSKSLPVEYQLLWNALSDPSFQASSPTSRSR
jgi:hypothetical protein